MNILHLTTGHSPTDGRIFHREAYSLKNAGHQVTVLAKGNQNREREIDGIRVIEVATFRHRFQGIVRQAKMLALAKKIRPDVIHCHEPESLIVSHLLKQKLNCPVIYDIHDDYPEVIRQDWGKGKTGQIMAIRTEEYEQLVCPKTDYLIAAHEPLGKHYQQFGKPPTIVQNFPRTEFFHPTKDPTIEEKYGDNHVFVHAGQLKRARGSQTIIHAFTSLIKKHDDTILCILSGTPPDSILKQIKPEARNKIDFVGWVDHQKMANYLTTARAGISLMEKHPFYEMIVPTKIYEYMACKTTTIASNREEVVKLLHPRKSGILLHQDLDPGELTAAMEHVLQNPHHAQKIADRGYKTIQTKVRWETCEKALIGLYEQIDIHDS